MDKELDQIIHYYLTDYDNNEALNNMGLYSGRSGVLLFQALSYVVDANPKTEIAIANNLRNIQLLLKKKSTVSSSFANGVAGVSWLITYLNEIDLIEAPQNILDEADRYLEDSLKSLLENDDLDLLHGAIGISLYFLKRNNTQIISNVIDKLWTCCHKKNNLIYWERYDKYREADYVVDLGLAHGISGILYFLNKCIVHNIKPDRCKLMLENGLNFLFSKEQSLEKNNCFFANYYLVKDLNKEITSTQFSRLAWCYGDLGILTTLYPLMNTYDEKKKIELMLLDTAKRVTDDLTLIEDLGLCHGSSGVSLLFYELYLLSNNAKFLDISDFWLKKSISYFNLENRAQKHGFLEGNLGLGILLLNRKHKKLNSIYFSKWKEILFLK
ncbi:lanthionine synthetase LanC family protein [Pedobacter borealis]|uniref:lanthionine synthetase LanC family protein n=1 Tax=Pedobacter borealis TaxID=475254 RepID=UPI0004938336|nr:lanthionine synthetase LanC family protein [Pedobacter borealis]